jgi:hypothetical protein
MKTIAMRTSLNFQVPQLFLSQNERPFLICDAKRSFFAIISYNNVGFAEKIYIINA